MATLRYRPHAAHLFLVLVTIAFFPGDSLAARRRAVSHPAAPVLRVLGSDRYATAAKSHVLDPSRAAAMTIELEVFQTNGVTIYGAPIALQGPDGPVYAISVGADDVVAFAFRDRALTHVIKGDRSFPRRRWAHAALVLAGSMAHVYIDGEL